MVAVQELTSSSRASIHLGTGVGCPSLPTPFRPGLAESSTQASMRSRALHIMPATQSRRCQDKSVPWIAPGVAPIALDVRRFAILIAPHDSLCMHLLDVKPLDGLMKALLTRKTTCSMAVNTTYNLCIYDGAGATPTCIHASNADGDGHVAQHGRQVRGRQQGLGWQRGVLPREARREAGHERLRALGLADAVRQEQLRERVRGRGHLLQHRHRAADQLLRARAVPLWLQDILSTVQHWSGLLLCARTLPLWLHHILSTIQHWSEFHALNPMVQGACCHVSACQLHRANCPAPGLCDLIA